MYPAMLHSIPLATFASLIAPFGGFFASGFKRAFKIKVQENNVLSLWYFQYQVYLHLLLYNVSMYVHVAVSSIVIGSAYMTNLWESNYKDDTSLETMYEIL